ncbi:MAG: hypothetical protein LBQ50_14605 [Planctomycetaceae bacterium]|jgi:hypothetical protein|nr:hypothetical protein [Planctomycetaceae bacterium]
MCYQTIFSCLILLSATLVGAVEMRIDVPVLFVRQHNYLGLHIYDTFYKWRPGGGIYVLENPSDPPEQQRIRAVIDPHTPETLGEGVYSDPDLSWDASRILFCFKASQNGGTSIYEIGIDGSGLRQLTDCKTNCCNQYQGSGGGNHDVMPAYLPDGRVVFTSTRFSGLVPCANNGVNILHVMNADGSDIHPISVNNVNEFDPSVMPDGRILFGRWEYIDKTALTQQSTWTVFPDGTNETAQFANNLVFPEATLQLRNVPGVSHLICCTFTKHNAPPRGSIAMIDLRKGKDDIAAITNLEHPENPVYDQGESCDPWALSENLVLYSGQFEKGQKNSLMLIDRYGNKKILLSDPNIDLHHPIPVAPRPVPPVLADRVDRSRAEGKFFVQDVYAGNPGVPRGSIKWLRVFEETSRISPSPGPTVLNQTFLVSAALAFSSKNDLGIVPVEEDGSVFFTVPSGKAVYFQLLDKDYKLVRSMRTFIQAAPGTTRSCVGCHEYTTPLADSANRSGLNREPSRLQPESWGSGFIDYPSMVQPILNRHCVRCHGGEDGIESGLDLTGGWTEYFSNSYENLVSRREVIYTAPLIGGIDCMNGTAHWSAQILRPYSHGSGKAPLAEVVISGHENRFPKMTQAERELMLTWIDSNGLYYGTWNYTKNGYTLPAWQKLKSELIEVMNDAGCLTCHADEKGNVKRFEPDWINLEKPEWSRILRAPLPLPSPLTVPVPLLKSSEQGLGLGFCRDAKVDQNWQRLRMVTNSTYQHAVQNLDWFPKQDWRTWNKDGEPFVSFKSADDPNYQKMLRLIEITRCDVLGKPRIDMPNAVSVNGQFRQILPTPIPYKMPELTATVFADSVVLLNWEHSSATYGLTFHLYRNGEPIAETTAFQFSDTAAKIGMNQYTLILENNVGKKSEPIIRDVEVPKPNPLPKIEHFTAESIPGCVRLFWNHNSDSSDNLIYYDILRCEKNARTVETGSGETGFGGTMKEKWEHLTAEPISAIAFEDTSGEPEKSYRYRIRPISRRGESGDDSDEIEIAAKPVPKIVLFESALKNEAVAGLSDGSVVTGILQGDAKLTGESLDIVTNGQLVFPNRSEYNFDKRITVDFWAKIDEQTKMPVLISFGRWNESGWFVQWIGNRLRWHVAGVDCDGGSLTLGQWTHCVCQYDGNSLRIIQDGKPVAEKAARIRKTRSWTGSLMIGNYSGGTGEQYQLKGSVRDVRITNYVEN